MKAPRRQRIKEMHINRIIPSILTLLAISAGMTAIRFSLQDQWQLAGLAILVAALLDALDGRVARLLKGQSKFGAELDSLSDFLCFGVAPAIMLYLWSMQQAGRFGWLLSLLFAVCCALRLARFNTALDEVDQPEWAKDFFTGVPSPAGAGLALLPMFLSFQLGDAFFRSPAVVGFFLASVSWLLISSIPTYAFKKVKVPLRWILPVMLTIGIVTASLMTVPWATLSAMLIIYLATIPLSIRSYRAYAAGKGGGAKGGHRASKSK